MTNNNKKSIIQTGELVKLKNRSMHREGRVHTNYPVAKVWRRRVELIIEVTEDQIFYSEYVYSEPLVLVVEVDCISYIDYILYKVLYDKKIFWTTDEYLKREVEKNEI